MPLHIRNARCELATNSAFRSQAPATGSLANLADIACRVESQLTEKGISCWLLAKHCRIGENWRQAQVRGIMAASAQVVVLDPEILESSVLRTELILGEALGLPLFPVLCPALASDPAKTSQLMTSLRQADITYGRLAEIQPFTSDNEALDELAVLLKERFPEDSTATIPSHLDLDSATRRAIGRARRGRRGQ